MPVFNDMSFLQKSQMWTFRGGKYGASSMAEVACRVYPASQIALESARNEGFDSLRGANGRWFSKKRAKS